MRYLLGVGLILLCGCSEDRPVTVVMEQQGTLTITSEQVDGVRHGLTVATDPTGAEIYRIQYDRGQIISADYTVGDRVTRLREAADKGLVIQRSLDPEELPQPASELCREDCQLTLRP